MTKLIGIGACVCDKLIEMSAFPTEDTKIDALYSRTAGGGPTATALSAAARLGADAAYIGTLSTDEAGDYLVSDFAAHQVNTDLIRRVEGRTFCSWIILSRESGSRTCILDRGTLSKTQLDDAQKAAIAHASLLEVDGNDLPAAVEAADLIHAHGGKVLYDADGRYPGFEALLERADYLIPSERCAKAVTGKESFQESAEELFRLYHPEICVVTAGKEGGAYVSKEASGLYKAFKVDVRDTNGAGDVFHGAFCASLLRDPGLSLYDRCLFSGAVSAIKCTGVGARDSVPTYEETIKFIKERT